MSPARISWSMVAGAFRTGITPVPMEETMEHKNKIAKTLCEWGVCDESAIELYYPQVRDRDDIAVLRCNKSGVIFTSTSDHMDMSHYEEKHEFPHFWKEDNREKALVDSLEDDSRRKKQFLPLVSNKNWMDVKMTPDFLHLRTAI